MDGDTGYGNAMNVKRTVRGFAAAGAAGVLIEDQVSMNSFEIRKGSASCAAVLMPGAVDVLTENQVSTHSHSV